MKPTYTTKKKKKNLRSSQRVYLKLHFRLYKLTRSFCHWPVTDLDFLGSYIYNFDRNKSENPPLLSVKLLLLDQVNDPLFLFSSQEFMTKVSINGFGIYVRVSYNMSHV